MSNYPLQRRRPSDIDQLFGSLLPPGLFRSPVTAWPETTQAGWFNAAVDRVTGENGETVYKLDLPGISREDIKVDVDGKQLVISGERKSETEKANYIERSCGRFERRLPMPDAAAEDEISARLIDGVLTVTVPISDKQVESSRSITIE